MPAYLRIQAQTSAAGFLVVQAAEELIPSQWREWRGQWRGKPLEKKG